MRLRKKFLVFSAYQDSEWKKKIDYVSIEKPFPSNRLSIETHAREKKQLLLKNKIEFDCRDRPVSLALFENFRVSRLQQSKKNCYSCSIENCS